MEYMVFLIVCSSLKGEMHVLWVKIVVDPQNHLSEHRCALLPYLCSFQTTLVVAHQILFEHRHPPKNATK
uniref:Uncharacterized protein n=1 Tax=Arundo donax TaxID=35708 RepID=A0A0A9CQP1_ARUDO